MEATAIGFSAYGDVDVFEAQQINVQVNHLKNILVKVEHIGVNPVDAFIRNGNMSGGKSLNRFTVLGNELQGEIVELYEPIDDLAVGDKVIVRSSGGGYATYIAANNKNVFKIPKDMPLDFAGSFSATASTAYWGLHGGFYPLKDGDTIAIVGASGSVGSFLVQLAQAFDVTIIAVASEKNKERLIKLGADIFVDYRDPEAIEQHAKSADFVLDASLFNAGEHAALTLAKENATYIGMTTLPDDSYRPDVKRLFLSRTPDMTNDIVIPYLFNFYQKHGLADQIAYTLPFTVDGVKEAHRLLEGTRNSGKIIFKV